MSEVEYSIDLQKLYIEFLISDYDLFVRCNSILNPIYFDRSLSPAVKFIQEYADEYSSVPKINQITAKTGVDLEDIGMQSVAHRDWFLDSFEIFCRHKAIERAIINSTDKLENQEYSSVETLVREAVGIGLTKQTGTEYWESPEERLQRILEKGGGTSTGWKDIDRWLYGGLNNGELTIFSGPSGSGKSLFLQNLALNWSLAGLNVVYISLELSEDLCGMRLDSMITGYSTKRLFSNKETVGLKIHKAGQQAGMLHIVQLNNGVTVRDIRAYLKELMIKRNIAIDAVFVDYLDLMMPMDKRIKVDNLFIKDKFVSEELRRLAVETNMLCVSASQINRSGVDEHDEYNHSHISGGISKIYTADNVIGIFSSRNMRENGRVQVQFMKTRSSNGEGRKVDLKYCVDSMRISDLEEDDEDAETNTINRIYQNSTSDLEEDDDDFDGPKNVESNTERIRNILKRNGT